MIEKDEVTLKKAAMMKEARSRVRTHYSIKADAALNEILPALEKAFDGAISDRRPFEFDSDMVTMRLEALDRPIIAIEAGE